MNLTQVYQLARKQGGVIFNLNHSRVPDLPESLFYLKHYTKFYDEGEDEFNKQLVHVILQYSEQLTENNVYLEVTWNPVDSNNEANPTFTIRVREEPLSEDFNGLMARVKWKKLRKQKEDLLELAGTTGGDGYEDALYGVVHLIDAIQDTAVATGLKTEREVFGKKFVKRKHE